MIIHAARVGKAGAGSHHENVRYAGNVAGKDLQVDEEAACEEWRVQQLVRRNLLEDCTALPLSKECDAVRSRLVPASRMHR